LVSPLKNGKIAPGKFVTYYVTNSFAVRPFGCGRFLFWLEIGGLGTGRRFFSMTVFRDSFTVRACGQGTSEITDEVAWIVARSGVARGVAHVFCQHTSCAPVARHLAGSAALGTPPRAAHPAVGRDGTRRIGQRRKPPSNGPSL